MSSFEISILIGAAVVASTFAAAFGIGKILGGLSEIDECDHE